MKKNWMLAVSSTAIAALFLSACSDSSSGKTRSVSIPTMAVTELMYHPQEGFPEFVEIKLLGKSLSSMSAVNLRLDGAVEFTFPDEPLDVNEILVVTNDSSLFRKKYPQFSGRLFQWDAGFTLSNSGDVLEVKLDGKGDCDARFDNNPPWPSLADGKGSSLVYVGENPAYAESWAASKTQNGNPGNTEDPYYAASSVRINEILPYHGTGSISWIEFYNDGDNEVDIGGWQIVRADAEDSLRFIPSGITVPAKGYQVLYTLSKADGTEDSVSFVARGEAVYLRELQNGTATGLESGLEYAAVPTGFSAGVIALSDGSMQQGILQNPTANAKNSEIELGPIYISEVHYNPKDGDVEFLEIVNKSGEEVALNKNLNKSPYGWKISGVGFDFEGATLAAGEIALLIPTQYTGSDGYTSLSITPAEFREKWQIPESVQIFQYPGKLSNRGEKISIEEPMEIAKNLKGETKIYYHISDAILYSDDGLWPKEADGEGFSLNRLDFSVSGFEPSNWEAASPTPGSF